MYIATRTPVIKAIVVVQRLIHSTSFALIVGFSGSAEL
jgi:hypothetical protein